MLQMLLMCRLLFLRPRLLVIHWVICLWKCLVPLVLFRPLAVLLFLVVLALYPALLCLLVIVMWRRLQVIVLRLSPVVFRYQHHRTYTRPAVLPVFSSRLRQVMLWRSPQVLSLRRSLLRWMTLAYSPMCRVLRLAKFRQSLLASKVRPCPTLSAALLCCIRAIAVRSRSPRVSGWTSLGVLRRRQARTLLDCASRWRTLLENLAPRPTLLENLVLGTLRLCPALRATFRLFQPRMSQGIVRCLLLAANRLPQLSWLIRRVNRAALRRALRILFRTILLTLHMYRVLLCVCRKLRRPTLRLRMLRKFGLLSRPRRHRPLRLAMGKTHRLTNRRRASRKMHLQSRLLRTRLG